MCRADLQTAYRNPQSNVVIVLVVPVDSWLRDFVTSPVLIPLFSRPYLLLLMELAQVSATFQIVYRVRCARYRYAPCCCDYLASAAAFVSHSAFVLLMVKSRLDCKGME